MSYLSHAKTPWSWGRMHVILSEERKIESRCQLEKPAIALIERQSEELETTHERRPVNDQ